MTQNNNNCLDKQSSDTEFRWPSWLDPDGDLSKENPFEDIFESSTTTTTHKQETEVAPQNIEIPSEPQIPSHLVDLYIDVNTTKLKRGKGTVIK